MCTGPFSRSAVNFNAGRETAVSTNIVMALAVRITVMLLTPLFHYTPPVVLSSTIIAALLGLIDYAAAMHLWAVDKFDFLVCMRAYEATDVCAGKPPKLQSLHYRSVEQYPTAKGVPGILILEISSPIYFANACYLRERYIFR